MFLSMAIAAASCVYASDPKSRPLPCSATSGSMLGAPGDQSEHTQSGSECAEETPANTIEGFDHAATPHSPESPSASLSAVPTEPAASNVEQTENTKKTLADFIDMAVKQWTAWFKKPKIRACHAEAAEPQCNDLYGLNPYPKAFDTLYEIQYYIRHNKGTKDENSIRRWIAGKLPFDDYYAYTAPRRNSTGDHYDFYWCERDDAVDNLLRFFKYGTFNSGNTYECLTNIIACVIWNATESIRTNSVASNSGEHPQCCTPTLRLLPMKEMMFSHEYQNKYEYVVAMLLLFIYPPDSLRLDMALPRRIRDAYFDSLQYDD